MRYNRCTHYPLTGELLHGWTIFAHGERWTTQTRDDGSGQGRVVVLAMTSSISAWRRWWKFVKGQVRVIELSKFRFAVVVVSVFSCPLLLCLHGLKGRFCQWSRDHNSTAVCVRMSHRLRLTQPTKQNTNRCLKFPRKKKHDLRRSTKGRFSRSMTCDIGELGDERRNKLQTSHDVRPNPSLVPGGVGLATLATRESCWIHPPWSRNQGAERGGLL